MTNAAARSVGLGHLRAQPVDVVVVAVDGDQRAAVDRGLTILPASRSPGIEHDRLEPGPSRGAATALARLPVEAQATVVKPSCWAADSATATTRSLNEWVGLPLSSLTHSGSCRAPRPACRPGPAGSCRGSGSPGAAGSCPTGSSAAYRHIDCGPVSMPARVRPPAHHGRIRSRAVRSTPCTRTGSEGEAWRRSRDSRSESRGRARSARRQSGCSHAEGSPHLPRAVAGTDLAPAASSRARWLPGLHRAVSLCPSG